MPMRRRLFYPCQCAHHAGYVCGPQRRGRSGFGLGRKIDNGHILILEPGAKIGGLADAGEVQLARFDQQLVLEVGGGHGDAALHLSEALAGILRQVEGAIEQQVAAVGDGRCERQGAEVGNQHRLHGFDGFQSSQPGRQHRAGLVPGGADHSLIFSQDGAGNDGCQNFAFGLGLHQHLVAQAGMLHVKWNHLAQAEAQHRVSFSRFAGHGIEVQNEDADHRIRQDQGDGVGARRDLAEGSANRVCNGPRRSEVRLADAGDDGAGREGLKGVGCFMAHSWQCGGQHALGRKLHRNRRTPAGL
jgi:hypothetical protein